MKHKILVIGSGGREHAIAHAFSQSPTVEKVYVAPGNPGMLNCATIIDIKMNQFDLLSDFVLENQIDCVFVGPETPLSQGIVDVMQAKGICIFGPTQKAAQLESSKSFAKNIMNKYDIPTAHHKTVFTYQEALEYLSSHPAPIVIKADGLMAGKGVTVAMNNEDALHAIESIYTNRTDHCATVIEEYLEGEEFSLMAFVKGERVIPLPIAKDHKRAYDNDRGPNTGGMGAYSPVDSISNVIIQEAMEKVMKPIANAMVIENTPFTGILYGGFMSTSTGVKTIEFNCRFGDPETEVILPRIKTPLDQIVFSVLNDEPIEIEVDPRYALTVVLASNGYPGQLTQPEPIYNLDKVNSTIYHMGTSLQDNQFINTGGRVCCVTHLADTLDKAREEVYKEISKIDAKQCFYRKDIGQKST